VPEPRLRREVLSPQNLLRVRQAHNGTELFSLHHRTTFTCPCLWPWRTTDHLNCAPLPTDDISLKYEDPWHVGTDWPALARIRIMQRRQVLAVFSALLLARPLPVMAQTSELDAIIEKLKTQNYAEIRVRRTLLGRIRVTARGVNGRREIVLNPSTGAVLRDHSRLSRSPRPPVPDASTPQAPQAVPTGDSKLSPGGAASTPDTQGREPGVAPTTPDHQSRSAPAPSVKSARLSAQRGQKWL